MHVSIRSGVVTAVQPGPPRIAARHGGGLPAAGSLQFDDGRSGGGQRLR